MRINVRSLSGDVTGHLSIRQDSLDVRGTDTVGAVKLMLHQQTTLSPPPHTQTLKFRGQRLDDGDTLAESGVTDGATIHLAFRH